ncbi:hypothetical protein LCGC14_1467000 [marine sediment metagenome]|uniref:Helix-turn-helix domain-containing protein n=1 Tax=marine sediment metagenome TaxID=412755 RepID=A0A0F9MFD8_9ZZZZ
MKYTTISEAAKILNMSTATIRTRLKSGQWPYYRFGIHILRLNIDEIKDLARQEQLPTPGRR